MNDGFKLVVVCVPVINQASHAGVFMCCVCICDFVLSFFPQKFLNYLYVITEIKLSIVANNDNHNNNNCICIFSAFFPD